MLLKPGPAVLQTELEAATGINVDGCLQCGCCSGGCSSIEFMDHSPRQLIQLIKLGDRETLINSQTVWYCASCRICEDRCPAGINIPGLMDGLRQIAVREQAMPENRQTLFHRLFIGQVKRFGRLHEGLLTLVYSWRSKTPLPDVKLMWRFLARGRVDFKLPHAPARAFRSQVGGYREGGEAKQ